MFDHLDDPHPILSGDEFRTRTLRRGRRLRRRRRVAAGMTACGSTVLLSAAAVTWWGKEKLDDIERVEFADDTLAPPAAPGEPTTFLVVGTDNTEGMAPEDPVAAGRDRQSDRADAILLVRADPAGPTLSFLSVPRDLWVADVDGAGTPGKVNQALAGGGPEQLVAVVRTTLGVDVHHYVEVEMVGFRRLVDAVGGVDLSYPSAVRDAGSGLDLPGGTCTTLDGDQALALVRSRRLEVLGTEGTWVSDATGDLGRQARQRAFAAIAIDALLAGDWRSPVGAAQAIDLLADHATLDSDQTVADLARWAHWLTSTPAPAVVDHALPVRSTDQAEVSALELDSGWPAAVEAFADGNPPAGPPPAAPSGAATVVPAADAVLPTGCP